MKHLLTSIIILVIISLVLWWKFSHDLPDLSPKVKVCMIKNPKMNKYFYLKNITRGMNYSVNILSKDSTKEIGNSDFVFDSDIIYYKFNNDSLIVITTSPYKSPITEAFPINIQCKVIIDNLEYMRFEREYRTKGFSVFPHH